MAEIAVECGKPDPGRVCRVRFSGRPPKNLQTRIRVRCPNPALRRAFEAYWETGQWRFGRMGTDLPGLTRFEVRVLGALKALPPRQLTTYRALARQAGFPRAARAVGNALRKNPCPIVIPCHRVIASDGSLGGYSPGLSWKRFLLRLEGLEQEFSRAPFRARSGKPRGI